MQCPEIFYGKRSENRVLWRIFGYKRGEVTGDWRRLHNEELHNLYTSPNIARVKSSRRMMWAENVACLGEIRNAYKILLGKPEGKRRLGRCIHILEDNIRMHLREIGWKGVDCIHLAQDKGHLLALMTVNLGFHKRWGIY
jgi:hypothetical protein